MENIDNLSKFRRNIGEKAIITIKKKYRDYAYLEDNKQFIQYIKKGYSIVYVKNNKTVKCQLVKIMSPNIIKLQKGDRKWFIYLHDKHIFYKHIIKKQSLRDAFSDIINGNIKINKIN